MNLHRAASIVFSLMLTVLAARLLVLDGSLIHTWRLAGELEDLSNGNAQLKARNTALENEVADLKSGVAAIEARARMALGLIKKDETFYLVVEPRS